VAEFSDVEDLFICNTDINNNGEYGSRYQMLMCLSNLAVNEHDIFHKEEAVSSVYNL